jgi:chemotaxis protein methyltransferase CheR
VAAEPGVGETYFRRDAEALDWLAREHLAPLLQRRQQAGQRYLRVWSAACCTGEEAYSLLFLIDELLAGSSAEWTIEILASDINGDFLARAEQACYGANAFRRNEEAFRSRYFLPEGPRWRVRPAWRGRIRFICHNLASEPLPNPGRGLAAVDLILCRNVLMYFSAERAAATLQRLLACLGEEGLLLLSAVEAGLATQAGCRGFWAGSNYALTPSGRFDPPQAEPGPQVAASLPSLPKAAPFRPVPRPAQQVSAPLPVVPDQLYHAAEAALAQGEYGRAREVLQNYLALPGLGTGQRYEACLLMARSWADRQRGDEAQEWLQRAVALDPTALAAYWLQAVLAKQEGDPQAALQALHKVLYLDAECVMAHFQQGLLLRETGRRQAADRALRLCRQLLLEQPGEARIALGDGLSCAQLRQLCEQLLEGSACPHH